MKGFRNRGKSARLLRDLESLSVDVATIEETHFSSDRDTHVLRDKFDVFSAYSLQVRVHLSRSLDADVHIVKAVGDRRLVESDISSSGSSFLQSGSPKPQDMDLGAQLSLYQQHKLY